MFTYTLKDLVAGVALVVVAGFYVVAWALTRKRRR